MEQLFYPYSIELIFIKYQSLFIVVDKRRPTRANFSDIFRWYVYSWYVYNLKILRWYFFSFKIYLWISKIINSLSHKTISFILFKSYFFPDLCHCQAMQWSETLTDPQSFCLEIPNIQISKFDKLKKGVKKAERRWKR